jgi:hypothetical protein
MRHEDDIDHRFTRDFAVSFYSCMKNALQWDLHFLKCCPLPQLSSLKNPYSTT